MLSIAAIVATHNRPELLASRALASIAGQTRPPDILIVVDDSSADLRPANKAVVEGFPRAGVHVIYIENRRTQGASGAWNAALHELRGIAPSSFVAILDDDDMWDSNYLEQCEYAVLDQHLDMVAAGIVYNRSAEHDAIQLKSPESLEVDDLLVRSTYIQGSNLFVRLSRMLEADGFDEALRSTTDRDICIRLADLGTVKYGRIEDCLVQHYAENDRPRLSTPGSEVKCAGLQAFYRKYRARMTAEQRVAFIGRSMNVFGCNPAPNEELQSSAESYVSVKFDAYDLMCLGIGSEGVVLTDGWMVYKYFHFWRHRANEGSLKFLRSLIGSLSDYNSLPDIREVRSDEDILVITYPFEPGQTYEGGRLDDMLTLLRECREAGISCRNIHPDNLLATPTGLKLIDIGFDIVPHTEDDFEQMCRRAYLTYRFHHRSDLKRLMTRSLTDLDMPELSGFDMFMRALHPSKLEELSIGDGVTRRE
ncbi:MAG: glycosyltransferase [Chloroflexi bacterium]|nr:glycosyltransferase [Chloroflexota bacterium]